MDEGNYALLPLPLTTCGCWKSWPQVMRVGGPFLTLARCNTPVSRPYILPEQQSCAGPGQGKVDEPQGKGKGEVASHSSAMSVG